MNRGADIAGLAATALSAAAPRASGARRLVVAGGGTGGHLFPGIAIAREFAARHPGNRVLFVSTGNAFERAALERAGFPLATITVAGIKGRSVWDKLGASVKIPVGIVESVGILVRFKPDLVLGVGSYAAGPLVAAAWLLRKPVALHEQNMLPGITNRVLSRFARRIYVSFEASAGRFAADKALWTGNPVRMEFLASGQEIEAEPPGRERPLNVLIIGGSQGAHAINMAVIEALPDLASNREIRFVHQTGAADEARVAAAYRAHGVSATVAAFFDDMDRQYHAADFIVCRAGATTVAEIAVVGRAALFVPFPFAADNHQVLNAGALVDHGAAEMIEEKDLSPALLAKRIRHYAADRRALDTMAERARALGRPGAAKEIVDDLMALSKSRGNLQPVTRNP